jgi:hypothetical protein
MWQRFHHSFFLPSRQTEPWATAEQLTKLVAATTADYTP